MNLSQRITAAEFQAAQKSVRRRSKYGNKPVVVDGERFDSKSEAERYSELRLMQLAGEISELKVHVRVPLIGAHDMPILYESENQAEYEADFSYIPRGSNLVQLEDFKGKDTAASKIKRAIVAAMFGRPVVVTRKGRAA